MSTIISLMVFLYYFSFSSCMLRYSQIIIINEAIRLLKRSSWLKAS